MHDLFRKRYIRKYLITLSLSIFFLGMAIACQIIFISASVPAVLYVILVYVAAWGIRSICVENRDTMFAGMDEVELMAMRAAIDAAIKARKI